MAYSSLWVAPALLGASGVGLGAFGSHALRNFNLFRNNPTNMKSWETAVQYQLLHAVALLSLRRSLPRSLVIAGTVLFSGSIYGLTLAPDPYKRALSPLTPLGGSLLIAAWLSLMF